MIYGASSPRPAWGVLAMMLGIVFQKPSTWPFSSAGPSTSPLLAKYCRLLASMLLFWKRTTAKGIAAGVTRSTTGLPSLAWILLSQQCYKDVYHIDPKLSIIPFSQPALVTVPLSFIALILVSLMTTRKPANSAA